MNLHEKVAMKREAGAVTRWHTLPHHGVDTVANHSWNATMLLLELYPTASRRLIVYMLNHDVIERWIGDIPASSKGMFPKISAGVIEAEVELRYRFNLPETDELEEDERHWARAIDALESVIWCHEQIMMGNQMVGDAMGAIGNWIMGKEWIPAAIKVFYVNYKWKRTTSYIIEGKHYGDNE